MMIRKLKKLIKSLDYELLYLVLCGLVLWAGLLSGLLLGFSL
jgi:hypothetical protein